MGWQWHQLDHMQIICTSLQTDNHASTSLLNRLPQAAGFNVSTTVCLCVNTTTPTQLLYDLFPGPPGWAGARREFLDFMVQGKINRRRHRPSSRAPLHPGHLHHPPLFYRPDALPAAQPTVLKHYRQLAHSDLGEEARVLLSGVTCIIFVPYLCVWTVQLEKLWMDFH